MGGETGHFHSLQEVESSDNLYRSEQSHITENPIHKALCEEELILGNSSDTVKIVSSLRRLEGLQGVTSELLSLCNLFAILNANICPSYPSTTEAGRIARRVLRKFENLCQSMEDYEPLNLTLINTPYRPSRKKGFKDLLSIPSSSSAPESNFQKEDHVELGLVESSIQLTPPPPTPPTSHIECSTISNISMMQGPSTEFDSINITQLESTRREARVYNR